MNSLTVLSNELNQKRKEVESLETKILEHKYFKTDDSYIYVNKISKDMSGQVSFDCETYSIKENKVRSGFGVGRHMLKWQPIPKTEFVDFVQNRFD